MNSRAVFLSVLLILSSLIAKFAQNRLWRALVFLGMILTVCGCKKPESPIPKKMAPSEKTPVDTVAPENGPDRILVPNNPKWIYTPYDSTSYDDRIGSDYFPIFQLKGGRFFAVRGYFTIREGYNKMSLSEGDGWCEFEGALEESPEKIILRADKENCLTELVIKNLTGRKKAEPVFELKGPIIYTGLDSIPFYTLDGRFYTFESKSPWKLFGHEFDFSNAGPKK